MSSGFSENKGLWGLLSLSGSQNLPYVDLILYLPITYHSYKGGGSTAERLKRWTCNPEVPNSFPALAARVPISCLNRDFKIQRRDDIENVA